MKQVLLISALLAAAVLMALALRAYVQRGRLKRSLPARHAPRLRHPVVLAHGVFGFDEIAVAGRRHRYFRNIAEELAGSDLEFWESWIASPE